MLSRRHLAYVVLTWLSLLGLGASSHGEEKIQVTVIAVLASTEHEKIDPRLTNLAPELIKKNNQWTGFELERRTAISIKIGGKDTFPLVDQCVVVITVKKREESGCVTLLIQPPTLGEISYTSCCGKFVPIVTRYQTADKKQLIIAIMARPCNKK